jgi:ABC-2 type transport system ATP-binding protein
MHIIDVKSLVYEYPGKRALDDISFSIPQGSITALVGPNGAGKTTLLRCLAALDEPFSGHISIAGIDVLEEPRRVHQQIGYLSDFFGLYNDLTVKQCLVFMAQLHQLPKKEAEARVAWVSELLELTPYLPQKSGTLSRGWRQRLGMAQAIIHRPQLLLLDEPASGLDPEARLSISSLFRNLQAQGMTLVVSSHILAELEDYCTDMLILRDGRIIEHRGASAQSVQSGIVEIRFVGDATEASIAFLRSHNAVSVLDIKANVVRFTFSNNEEERHRLLKALIEQGAKIYGFTAERERLADVYMSLSQERRQA